MVDAISVNNDKPFYHEFVHFYLLFNQLTPTACINKHMRQLALGFILLHVTPLSHE